MPLGELLPAAATNPDVSRYADFFYIRYPSFDGICLLAGTPLYASVACMATIVLKSMEHS